MLTFEVVIQNAKKIQLITGASTIFYYEERESFQKILFVIVDIRYI